MFLKVSLTKAVQEAMTVRPASQHTEVLLHMYIYYNRVALLLLILLQVLLKVCRPALIL